ncbi:MAG TPA: tRNA (adenine-N1)-methyltransferase [Nitrososphaerales archaeon]|nr:tRNA (adenine-N1)-methyltransferase [Nitrososphaerales archaeon]
MSSDQGNTEEDRIKDGDRVLLYLDNRRTWLVRTTPPSQFHTHAGIINLGELVGKKYGDAIRTTLGDSIFLLRPVTLDFIMKSERRTQIVYPKDFAYISARSGLRSGCRVIECGTGSGALTTYFASIVSPGGLVCTFEERVDFYEIAKRNVEKAGLNEYVRFANANLVTLAISEADREALSPGTYDLAMIDIGDPWNLLEIMHKLLKGGGFAFCICPTTNQLETVASTMEGKFVDIESAEILLRKMEARVGKTRPSMRMIGHTCYLISGRKVNFS